MTITNLYAKYLLVDRLAKVAEGLGLSVDYIKIGQDGPYAKDVHLQVSLPYVYTVNYNQRAEDATVLLMEAMPELRLERKEGLMHLKAESSLGLTFEFYTGTGVCERVQVGTKTIPARPATEAYEIPIFEVRCIDPLNALVSA